MFKQLTAFGKYFESYMINRGRTEARRVLLQQDLKTLHDIGINRDELEAGVKNWPWDGSVTKNAAKGIQVQNTNKAIRELSTYSDRELHDLGINRGMIADAVANGRTGIDNDKPPTRPLNTGGDRQAA